MTRTRELRQAKREEMATHTFTAVIHRENDWYVAECPEVGTASQGITLEESIANLREATELYLEETAYIVVPNERTSGSVRVNISQVTEKGRKMENRGQR